ncbi:DUF6266 family protein [Lentimicrobium sp. S6]|uniref:DUF6266 family protein n=1 Tax=Lentimicrobium sp. S6 TaxID=2735872 RepID=UPI001556EC5C|nr:DUF6266 family protein [Lentimicrobium sp. S6]NPD47964.1 hypothetical protein [Lentimicrobium sp. S6]
MGTIKRGILGGVSGKIGNVVGSSWKGIDYLKTLPSNVNDAKSDVQIANRSKFLTVVRFLQPLTEFIRIGFKSLAVKKTAFNAAVSYNYHEAVTGDYPDIVMDYSKVSVSQGSLTPAYNTGLSSTVAAEVNLTWADNSGQGSASADDVAMVVVYNPELKDAVFMLNAGARSDLSANVSLPDSYSGTSVHCYLCFTALSNALGGQAGKSISKSVYVGSVAVM